MTISRAFKTIGVAALIYGALFLVLGLAVSWSFPIPGPPQRKEGIYQILDGLGCIIFDCLHSLSWILPQSTPSALAWPIVLAAWTTLIMALIYLLPMIIRNKPNKAVDSTATRVTPPASSLRSGQESRHGQP
jgi:hypothetical protein